MMILEDLHNKVISLSTSSDTLAIKEASFVDIEGRRFLTGRIPRESSNNNWAEDKRCAIAWDSVTDFVIFDSESDYIEGIKKNE